MAYLQMNSFSQVLSRQMAFDMLLPNDVPAEMKQNNEHYQRPAKTLFLLHGYSAGSKAWLLGSSIEEFSLKYNLAVVMPNGENSFYVDGMAKPNAFGRYIGEELPAYIRETFGYAGTREDTWIMGLSMGGFGAIRLGLKYADTFGRIGAMSSALIIHNIRNKTEGFADGIADYAFYRSVFGDLDQVEGSDKNPEKLIRDMQTEGRRIPPIYMTCGTEDFLLEENRTFKRFLDMHQVPVSYKESAGTHDWEFWGKELEPALQWMLEITPGSGKANCITM